LWTFIRPSNPDTSRHQWAKTTLRPHCSTT